MSRPVVVTDEGDIEKKFGWCRRWICYQVSTSYIGQTGKGALEMNNHTFRKKWDKQQNKKRKSPSLRFCQK